MAPAKGLPMKPWIGSALAVSGHEYGAVAVVAATREEALAKARAALARQSSGALTANDGKVDFGR